MSKFRISSTFLTAALALVVVSDAHADWTTICPPPPMQVHPSNDFSAQLISNPLFSVSMGTSGTFNYAADDDGGCFADAVNATVRGRIAFSNGPVGSIHSDIDDGMGITWGSSLFTHGTGGRNGYAVIDEDAVFNTNGRYVSGTTSMFGVNGFSTTFVGESDFYFLATTTNGNVQINLRVDLVGDAARLDWRLTNVDALPHNIGMRFGQHVALVTQNDQGVGTPWTNIPVGNTYVTVPGIKPPRTERRFVRNLDPSGYPSSVGFHLSQQDGYGFRVDNSVSDATNDTPATVNGVQIPTAQTNTDAFVLGQSFFLLGTPGAGDSANFPDIIFQEPISDVAYTDDTAFIQSWSPQAVAAGTSRTVVAFYRTTWGDSLYSRPYSVTVDTPKVINLDPADASTYVQNPFTIRVWVNNTRGYATNDQKIPLQNVKVDLVLPEGLTAIGGSSKIISRIDARQMQPVDFTVQASDFANGDLTYQVKVLPVPGPEKIVTGVIRAVSQPKIVLRQNANLITSPWTFDAPVWDEILGLQPDIDYTAFTYDPVQKGYIVSTGPERGKAQWIISKVESALALGGNPVAPTDWQPTPDEGGGAPLIIVKPGWNLIGNPYQVAIQLGQIVGVTQANPNQAYTFSQLVQLDAISGSLAFWDTGKQNYEFIQSAEDRMEPQKGYWIFVKSSQDVVLRYPAVFEPFVRSSTSKVAWQQSDKQWRLQLAARGSQTIDDQNFIGLTTSVATSKQLQVFEAPMAPIKGAISLGVEKLIGGEPTRLAQNLSEKTGKQEFVVKVDAKENGPVTVTWPNLSTIPKNVRAKLIDPATGESKDLRKVSGYTFQAQGGVTREFKIQIEPGVVSRAVIGNVIVTPVGRAGGAQEAVRLNYTLASDATTSIRIISANGREIMTLSRGRAATAGQNEITWNLRDQANRAVAPGTYRAEIIAEGDGGERVRKIVPILVTR